jgi:hypothetical protein
MQKQSLQELLRHSVDQNSASQRAGPVGLFAHVMLRSKLYLRSNPADTSLGSACS